MTGMPDFADRSQSAAAQETAAQGAPAKAAVTHARTGMKTMKRARSALVTLAALASVALGCIALGGVAVISARAQEATPAFEPAIPKRQSWSFSGPFGIYNTAQLQRGYKIYREVCSTCHSMINMKFRNLAEPGGPEFTEGQVQALAAEYKVQDGPNDQGDMFDRPGRPADPFPKPFANEALARLANGGALPPDMSVLAKARSFERYNWFPADIAYGIWNIVTQYQTQGPDYISALLQGYKDPPKGFDVQPGQNYNEIIPGGRIAMPQPLKDGQIEYPKGPDGKPVVPETLAQYSKDVAAFLMWVAEPRLDQRKRTGFEVMLYLLAFAGLMYFVKKRVWASVHA
jgi:ubiquinol-cytochrome c reductase cytochrome c1 subunit